MVEAEKNFQVMASLMDFLATETAEAQEQLVNGCRWEPTPNRGLSTCLVAKPGYWESQND